MFEQLRGEKQSGRILKLKESVKCASSICLTKIAFGREDFTQQLANKVKELAEVLGDSMIKQLSVVKHYKALAKTSNIPVTASSLKIRKVRSHALSVTGCPAYNRNNSKEFFTLHSIKFTSKKYKQTNHTLHRMLYVLWSGKSKIEFFHNYSVCHALRNGAVCIIPRTANQVKKGGRTCVCKLH